MNEHGWPRLGSNEDNCNPALAQVMALRATIRLRIDTAADRRLLAELDELHGTFSGSATQKLCERAWRLFKLPG